MKHRGRKLLGIVLCAALVIGVATGMISQTAIADEQTGDLPPLPVMCKVDFDANGGTGDMPYDAAEKDAWYTLPQCGFTAPDYQKFHKWKVSGEDELFNPGDQIQITSKNTTGGVVTVTAIWEFIEVAEVTEKPEGLTLDYIGDYQYLTTHGKAKNGTMVYALMDDATTEPDESDWNPYRRDQMHAGTYYVWYKARGDETHGDSKPACVTAEIKKVPLQVIAVSKEICYNEEPDNDGVYYEGFVGYDDWKTPGVLGGTLDYDYNYKAGDDVGKYTITPKGVEANDYEITFVPATLTVIPIEIDFATVTLDKTQLIYNGKEQSVNVMSVSDGGYYHLSPGDYTVTGNRATDPGDYTVTVTGIGNYSKSATAKWSITARTNVPLGMTGWVQNSDGSWSYGDEDGNMTFGPVNLSGYVYCFNEDGKMITGWALVDGNWYYADPEGTVHHNSWMQVKGNWYHFGTMGEMAIGWIYLDGNWYHFGALGEMQTGWVWIGNDWYYFSENGSMVTGWLKDGNHWYWLNENGAMSTGWQLINGSWEKLGDNGAWEYTWDGK